VTHTVTHTIKRNGNVYDRLNPETHAVLQIARGYARDMPNDTWAIEDEQGEEYFSTYTEAMTKVK